METPTDIPKSKRNNVTSTPKGKKTITAPSEASGNTNWYQGVVNGILIVVGLGFITLIINYFVENITVFENLKDQVIIQNSQINHLTTQLEIFSNGKIKP